MYAGVRQRPAAGSVFGNGKDVGSVSRFSTKGRKYPYRLNLYDKPPLQEITLEEFETWAIDRLRLLGDIESAFARNRSMDEIKTLIGQRAKQYLPLNSSASGNASGVDLDLQRKKDHYSHFILRLAFCRSEELRQRFVRAESTLFRIRLETDDMEEKRRFIESLNFGWILVPRDEKATYRAQLMQACHIREESKFEAEQFFKVDWTKVTELVEKRRVFIHGGKAYVPTKEETSLVVAEFTSQLAKHLEMTSKALPKLDEDDRLIPILNHLSQGFTSGFSSDYVASQPGDGVAITAEMVPQLAKESFPFCMRSMYDSLASSKHLKHEGRQQLGLFLKGIGMSVEEAVVFWRRSFSTMTDDKFNKEYKYNIRHSYGLEGSRKNYSPRNCQQIIMGKMPGPGESHGCPFRHYSEVNLSVALQSTYNLSSADLKDILGAVKTGHYHVGCTRLFEIQHEKNGVRKGDGLGSGASVDHPNRYFERSRQLISGISVKDESIKAE